MEVRYGFTAERYEAPRKKKFRHMDCIFLTSALIVIFVCGLWILFHTAIKVVRHSRLRTAGTDYVLTMEQSSESLVSRQCREVCTTKDCLKTAASIISRTDSTIDPCEDFYGFSCGKYQKVSMDLVQRQQFMTDVSTEVLHVIVDLIEKIPKHLRKGFPGYSASKARNFYDSCKNFRSTEEMAIPSAFRYLESLGIKNWPFLNSNYAFIDPDLDEIIAWLTLYDANPIFSVEIPENGKGDFTTTSPGSGSSDLAIEVKVKTARRSLLLTNVFDKGEIATGMKDILDYFGMPDEEINSTIEDALTLEKDLQDIKQISRKRITKCSANASISCSAYEFDCTHERNSEMERWCTIIVKIMEAIGMREKYSHFNIILQDKFYLVDVQNVINRVSHRTIAHGLAMEFFLENSVIMNYHFRRTAAVEIYPKVLLNKLQEERALFCGLWVLIHVPALVEAVFYSTRYRGELQREGNDIYRDIQDSVVSLTRNMTWVDPEARESFEKLMQSVNISVDLHVKYVSDASEVDEFYDKLLITDESFLSNCMELKRFRTTVNILYHDDHSTTTGRQRSHFQLNPKYMWEIIYVDFSSFIYPLISIHRPRYSNLGTFGYVVSHEYGHGVEISLRDPKNMSASFENALYEKKKCLIDQYSEYEIDLIGKKVNGSSTLNENMADFFALRAAHEALRKHQESHGTEKQLPGLQFNAEQLFFISIAQFLCESNTAKTLEAYLEDSHSPNKCRVRGIMQNFKPFSEAFNCPLGSPMNPVEKCSF